MGLGDIAIPEPSQNLIPGERIDPKALGRSLKRTLPPYKLPSEIHLRDDLPKNESGKIMKQPLKDAWRPEA